MKKTSDAFNLLIEGPRRDLQPVGYKPSFTDLLMVYQTYQPKQDLVNTYSNECAVRMSVALSLAGFSFGNFPNKQRVKTGGRTGMPVTHVLGAEELANYLEQVWGKPERFKGKTLGDAASEVDGRNGVIYFNNCFVRKDKSAGDHVDLWWSVPGKYFNQILGIGAGVEDHTSTRSLFRKADGVRFWQLQ